MSMNLLIRADSSSTIGLGHIMRCLVLAQQYPNATITFACQNLRGNIIDTIPHPVHILTTNEPQELITLIQTLNIDKIIFDHYDIDKTFEKQIKEQTAITILSLDDTYQKHHCDILLNHNIYGDAAKYEHLVPQNCELQCGAKFTLLRDEFIAEKKRKNVAKEAIFIGMGGADSANLSQEILEALLPLTNRKINIVTTSANPHIDSLQTFTTQYPNVKLHINSHQIAHLMNQSLLAIATPSVILNELFYLDIAFIAIQTAENQKYMGEFLRKNKYDILESWDISQFQSLIEGKL